MDRFQEAAMTEINKQVAPLAEVMHVVRDKQRGMASATQGQIESLQKTVAGLTITVEAIRQHVEAACQDANAAKVETGTLLEIVQDLQASIDKQRDAVRSVLESLR
jgi:archaellum component FlaC